MDDATDAKIEMTLHCINPRADLRQATRADIAAIETVRYAVTENTLRPGVILPEDIRREIEDTGRGWVVETVDHGVIGFAIGNAVTGNIWALFVGTGFQGCGYGDRLHAAMVDWLWDQGLESLWLETGRSTRARGFYERRGWQLTGEAPHDQVRYELVPGHAGRRNHSRP